MKTIKSIDLMQVTGGHNRAPNGGLTEADKESDNLLRRGEQGIRWPSIKK